MTLKINTLAILRRSYRGLADNLATVVWSARGHQHRTYRKLDAAIDAECNRLDGQLQDTYQRCEDMLADNITAVGIIKNTAIDNTLLKQNKLRSKL